MVAWPLLRSSSSAALTVTVCAVLQFEVVKVRDVGDTVRSASPPSAFATVTITRPVGTASSTTV